jgi:hypothetical protein
MNLGEGEYIIVSTCLKGPYNYKNIESFINSLNALGAICVDADFIKINPNKANYDILWNSELETFTLDKFNLNELESNLLSSVNIILKDKIKTRLQINFLDELSYEVCLLFNYTELVEELNSEERIIENLRVVEELGLILFRDVNPIYGFIAIENNVNGLVSIINGYEYMPLDKAFYNNYLISTKYVFESITKHAVFSTVIEDCGVYFRKTQIDDFKFTEEKNMDKLLCILKGSIKEIIK